MSMKGHFLEDLYQKFELGFFSTIEQAVLQPLHFRTNVLSVQYKIPEPQVQEMLLDWAERTPYLACRMGRSTTSTRVA